jgi:hypothetical protein
MVFNKKTKNDALSFARAAMLVYTKSTIRSSKIETPR